MARIVLIDGNSILNRAFYGIMGSKMLMTEDGTYTNAVYGFLNIMFKIQEDLNPEYMVVALDKKGPTKRHEMYKEYKANRKGMPQELAEQMPIIKEILEAMKIKIIEKDGYEGDDIVGTLARYGEKNKLEVTIVSGDRDNFQLATDKTTIQIPRTKAGKTEVDNFDRKKVIEEYGVEPVQLIEVKGLMGDTSDNIPGVPGIGEKTAINLIKEYKTIDNLYKCIEEQTDSIKGKAREKLIENKELAYISRKLGEINTNAPIEENLEEMKIQNWDNKKVLELFKKYRFNRFIDRFSLQENSRNESRELKNLFELKKVEDDEFFEIIKQIEEKKQLFYYLGTEQDNNDANIINKKINSISIVLDNTIYFIRINSSNISILKQIFENKNINLYGFELSRDYILLKQLGIQMDNLEFDVKIAAYLLNPTTSKYTIEGLAMQYLELDVDEYLEENGIVEEKEQLNLFDMTKDTELNKNKKDEYENAIKVYCISKLYIETSKMLKQHNAEDLFNKIEMPIVKVLANMQYQGVYVDKNELIEYGDMLKHQIEELTKQIYEIAGCEFNINSPKQLGELLFEKLKLPNGKKNKNGYSTEENILDKIKNEHPIIEKILEYRGLVKLNSTYVEGLIQYINKKDSKIHSYFHQTVTATGRISSTEPNLQNIPTKVEMGKKIRKAFKAETGKILLDADYSQIELRVLAHISNDTNMIEAFNNNEDIHKQAASKVFNIPLEEVTHEERSKAKAVNFGIVYGISDFGLAEQIGVSRKIAKEYINQYLEKYNGIKEFMDNIVEEAKKNEYVETLFKRRRYIPELKSNSYMVRQFGSRVAMNTPIQGTAADIMKIAMIDVFNKLEENNLKSKIILQIHDELIIETLQEEKEIVRKILKESMENAIKLKVPLLVELQEANNWYDAK